MENIGNLLLRHRGQKAWIFGKGPSLDCFSIQSPESLRICINESLLHVAEPTYFFAHDEVPIQRVSKQWPPSCRAILQPERAQYARVCGIAEDAIYTYDKHVRDHRVLDLSAQQMARQHCLFGDSGTVHSALHFCRLIGVSSIVLVGFDGSGGYAESLKMEVPPGGGQHDRIRRDSIDLLKKLDISFHFLSLNKIE